MVQVFNWKFFEQVAVALIQFGILLVFVRFVTPMEMGIAIICLAIIHIVNNLFVNSLSKFLIQKENVDELDYSTILLSQLALATVFYSLLYGIAGVLANWLQLDVIVTALRIISVTLFFYAISSLYKAHIIRTENYYASFWISVSSASIAAILCFFLAIFQYGLYTFLLWTFFYQFYSVLLLLLFYKWRPRIRFSIERLTHIFIDGWKLMVPSIADVLLRNGQLVAIGHFYNPLALSFYVRGERFSGVFVQQTTQEIHTTLHPKLVKFKDDTVALLAKMRETIVLSGFVMFPLLTFLFVMAEPLVVLLFGERWLMTVPFIQIFCVYYAFLPVASILLQTIIVLDQSNQLKSLKLELTKKGILLLIWVVSFPFGVQAVAGSMIVFILINLFLNRFLLEKYINYPVVQLLKDVTPAILLSSTMGVLIYILNFILPSSSILLIVTQFVLGALFYGSLAYTLKLHGWKLFVKTTYPFYRKISRKRSSTM